ncbi:Glutamine transport ATP-binding protein GlnQ [Planctomycetes bacterium Poly30]|uniref:Glutamine transport ATP-binding protein GlnQ n=2 Tax=Saltatorellus ferox TaxID=2528018 RepID=A0A518EXB6_9BACT|nr:Glutamine transport ATP-binding protein GlnQ [Planctomycetes bacterium Poly30]
MRGVSLGYGDRTVLSGIDLELERGAFATVTGPSGSGKSTFLRAAAGLLPAESGAIERSFQRVGWVPQAESLGLLHPVSALEVASAGSARRGRAARTEAEAALEALGLAGRGASRFVELSGGQRQRVLVARALVQGAELLIFDEPTSALDDASSVLVREAVARRAREGATILYATHQPGELHGLETHRITTGGGGIQCEVLAWT